MKSIKRAKNLFLTMIITIIGLFVFNIDVEACEADTSLCVYDINDSILNYGQLVVSTSKGAFCDSTYPYHVRWFPNRDVVQSGKELYFYIGFATDTVMKNESIGNPDGQLLYAWNKYQEDSSAGLIMTNDEKVDFNKSCPMLYFEKDYNTTLVNGNSGYKQVLTISFKENILTNPTSVAASGGSSSNSSGNNVPTIPDSGNSDVQTKNDCNQKQIEYMIDSYITNSFVSKYNQLFENMLSDGYNANNYEEKNEQYAKDVDVLISDTQDDIQKSIKEQLSCNPPETLGDLIYYKLSQKTNTLEGSHQTELKEKLTEWGFTEESINSITNNYSEVKEEIKESIYQMKISIDEWTELQRLENSNCNAILSDKLVDQINEIFTWLRIGVPILLIILGVMDFSKAVLFEDGSSNGELNKAVKTFIKRCIIAVAIFFVPTIINLLVTIFNSVSDIPLTTPSSCGIE